MSQRELVVLGTASQVPTRDRNHNGYLLRWDGEGLLFDPGEGTQRQFTFAGVAPTSVTRICLTHLHGDHCLGLPGMLQRLSLDRVAHPVDLYFPASAAAHVDRLRRAAIFDEAIEVRSHPCQEGAVATAPPFDLVARRLEHRVDTLGWRVEEPPGRRMLPDRLEAAGVRGADIGRLQREGTIEAGGRRVTVEEVSEPRPGQRFAFVMDTALCEAAFELAAEADLLVCEATFLSRDQELAHRYGHLTAAQAARIAAEAGARRLVLTHFSQRYADADAFHADAAPIFPEVVVARDLDRVAVPPRR